MRPGAAGAAGLALAAALSLACLRCQGERARHLAVPVLADPPAPPAPPPTTPVEAACAAEELSRVGARVTALLPAQDGGLWVGTFDAGVLRLDRRGRPAALPGLEGRRRMVNALAEDAGTLWAATQGGLLALAGPRAGEVLLADEAVSALAAAGGTLYAGTGAGLRRVGAGGAEALDALGAGGERLRVTALAAGEGAGTLWIGTSSGAYALPAAALVRGGPLRAVWRPLVFGAPPSGSNVVTALAVAGDAAVAGTDDGGLARIDAAGAVAGLRLAEPLANQVNPGAAAAAGGALAFGTQGGGLLLVKAGGGTLAVARPTGLARASVSAVAASAGGWLVGTAEGEVLRVACP